MNFPRMLAALCLVASAACAEEVSSYSSSAGGTNGWRSGGLRIEATNRVLRMTLLRDGAASALLDRHCAAMPNGLVRWLGRVEGRARATLEIRGGATNSLALRGWDEPADFVLPPAARSCVVAVRLEGDTGAVLELRELLVTGSLDLDPPLLLAQGSRAEAWNVQGDAVFASGGVTVRGRVESRDHFAFTNSAVVVVRVAAAEADGIRVGGRAWGGAGEQLGEVVMGAAEKAGVYRFDASSCSWPAGCATVSMILQPASTNGSATVSEILVGREPQS